MHYEFACQSGEHIGAVVHCLQTAVGEFSLNRHRDQAFTAALLVFLAAAARTSCWCDGSG